MSEIFEINYELRNINNYENFKNTIIHVRTKFQELFGKETLERIPLYIDNSTAGSGHTPMASVILQK